MTREAFNQSVQDEINRRLAAAEAEIAAAKKLMENPDPRIGKLCKAWDDDKEPENKNADYVLVINIINDANYPIESKYGSYRTARLLTESEIDQYVRSDSGSSLE